VPLGYFKGVEKRKREENSTAIANNIQKTL
jgi:hypothetical protein